jgi:hypothetical protein
MHVFKVQTIGYRPPPSYQLASVRLQIALKILEIMRAMLVGFPSHAVVECGRPAVSHNLLSPLS